MTQSCVLDAATWRVQDLARSVAFYERLGFRARDAGPGRADLVAAGALEPDAPVLLSLEADPVAPVSVGRGAYHLAFRLPTRHDLAAFLHRLASERIPVEGFADHLVSEAIYLPDPDGHGLEFTWDRPRTSWRYPGGALAIGTDPLDVADLLAELGPDPETSAELPADTTLGHVHLFAADVASDARWYRDVLGLHEVVSFGPWGTFLAADGYHHHVGLRRGAGPTDPQHDHGLVEIEARLDAGAYAALAAPEANGAKTLTAPSGHRWRVRPLPSGAVTT